MATTAVTPVQDPAVQKREYTNLEYALYSKSFGQDLARFLGSEEAAAAFVAEIFNQARRVPKLHQCTVESIRLNVARVAALRLNPALPNMVSLIPRNQKQPKVNDRDKDTYALELTLQYGYAGLRELVMRSPEVKDCWTQEVCVNDTYEPPQVFNDPPIFRRAPRFDPRGRVEGYFVVIELWNGNWRFLSMSVAEVQGHAQRYVREPGPAWNKGERPDVEDGLTPFDKMGLKTCLRMLCNGRDVPMTAEVRAALHADALADQRPLAAELQGYTREGTRPALTMSTGLMMDELLQDVGGVQDKVAVEEAITRETRQRRQPDTREEPAPEAPRAPTRSQEESSAAQNPTSEMPEFDTRRGRQGTNAPRGVVRDPETTERPPGRQKEPTDDSGVPEGPAPDLSGPVLFPPDEEMGN